MASFPTPRSTSSIPEPRRPHAAAADGELEALLAEIRACRLCAGALPHEPRPVVRARRGARLLVVGQAPGLRVHESGLPFDDASGERLRDWLGLDRAAFYDESRVAIVPMGFCFPGYDAKGGDLPPRRECAPAWRERLLARLPDIRFTVLVGSYAQAWHLGGARGKSVAETVRDFARHLPERIPLPHPSWRNNGWLKRNPWFARELLPVLKERVSQCLHTG